MIYAITLILLALGQSGVDIACDPGLAALFTPARPRMGRYEVCTTREPLERAAAADFARFHDAPIVQLEAADLFGQTGSYDRAKLARLYGGRRARVLRGWRQEGDRFESITLISPYPERDLERLNPGTMIVTWIK
jgi:hypothetical protein